MRFDRAALPGLDFGFCLAPPSSLPLIHSRLISRFSRRRHVQDRGRRNSSSRSTKHQLPLLRPRNLARCAHSAISSQSAGTTELQSDLFRSTRYRYVSNESYEAARRHVAFDPAQLGFRAAAAAGSRQCVKITKGSEGSFNRVLVLEMDDGKEVVAKIPTPSAGRPHFTTASEVATMAFLREKLSVPVPRILAWNSKADCNDVGAEYIIMEKAPGLPLSDVWNLMSTESKCKLVKSFASVLKSWMSITFKKYGSLYFSKDLASAKENEEALYVTEEGREVKDPSYAIGPSTGRGWFDDGRDQLDIYRGPWTSAEQYKIAIGHRDLLALEQLPKLPTSWIGLYGPGTYIPTRAKKRRAVQCYLELVKYLLPSEPSLSAATLWHSDIHAENIFVNPQNPSEITSIIDWQSTEVAPLFEYARQPGFLDHAGPPAGGFERPQRPANFDELDAEEQAKATKLWIDQTLEVYQRTLVRKTNPRLDRVRAFCETDAEELLLLARHLFVEGETHYLAAVEMLRSEPAWSQVPLVKAAAATSPDLAAAALAFPIDFTDDEVKSIYDDSNDAIKAMHAMDELKDMLGSYFPDRGVVLPEQYSTVKQLLKDAKEKIIGKYAGTQEQRDMWEKHWPFDD